MFLYYYVYIHSRCLLGFNSLTHSWVILFLFENRKVSFFNKREFGNFFFANFIKFFLLLFCTGELCSIVTPSSFTQLYNSKVICTGGVEGLVRNARWLWVAQTLIRCLSPEIITEMRTYRQQLAAAADTGTAIASSSNAAGAGWGGGEGKKKKVKNICY